MDGLTEIRGDVDPVWLERLRLTILFMIDTYITKKIAVNCHVCVVSDLMIVLSSRSQRLKPFMTGSSELKSSPPGWLMLSRQSCCLDTRLRHCRQQCQPLGPRTVLLGQPNYDHLTRVAAAPRTYRQEARPDAQYPGMKTRQQITRSSCSGSRNRCEE